MYKLTVLYHYSWSGGVAADSVSKLHRHTIIALTLVLILQQY